MSGVQDYILITNHYPMLLIKEKLNHKSKTALNSITHPGRELSGVAMTGSKLFLRLILI